MKKTATKAKSTVKDTKKPGKPLKIIDKPLDYTKYIKEMEKQKRK